MNIFKAIVDSARKSLRGEERLWKVFWLWGVVLYVGGFIIGVFSVFAEYLPFRYFIALCGLILIFVYPVMFIKSLWRCSQNSDYEFAKKFCKGFSVVFVFIHMWVSIFIFGGVIILSGLAK